MLPTILLSDFKSAVEQMEKFLNLFHRKFGGAELGFDSPRCGVFVEPAFTTACKAKVFEELEQEGIIRPGKLEKRLDKWPWWTWH